MGPAMPPQCSERIPRARFRELVAQAMDEIPSEIRARVENVAVVVEDEPDDETLVDLGLDPEEETLFGFYQGTPIGERSSAYSALPDRIVLYYLPLTDEFGDEYHLRREIRKTLVHEIGHYFGFSDKQLRRWGY
jgi:predicted Zn-dependent protease with MMP-like domain